MTPESPTTSVAGQVGTQSVSARNKRSSIPRIAGIFLFELFTVYQHGEKRSILRA